MSPPLRHPAALAAALLFLVGAPSRAEDCATLQALSLGDRLVVMLGSRSADIEFPELRLPGCGSASPSLQLRWTRDADGRWSRAGELPEGLAGAVFQHGPRPWSAGLPQPRSRGVAAITLGPLGPDATTMHYEAPREPGVQAVAVTALDKWHFALVQQLQEGRLLVEELTSQGRARIVERTSRVLIPTAWPQDARLLGVAGEPGRLAVFARRGNGELLAVLVEGESWRGCPPLSLPPAVQAVGLWLDGAPAALAAARDRIATWSLQGIAWQERGSVTVEPREHWAATGFGSAGDRVAAVAWTGDALEAWTWSDEAWTRERVPPGRTDAVLRPAVPEPARPTEGVTLQRSGLWVGLGALGALLGALLCARLFRRD